MINRIAAHFTLLGALLACLTIVAGCEREEPKTDGAAAATPAAKAEASPQPEPTHDAALLLSQAQFVKKLVPGSAKTRLAPGPAKLTFLYYNGGQWTPRVIEDPDANVFHKAMPFDPPGGKPGILTIGAEREPKPATLKLWHHTDTGWKGTLLWEATFGGTWNRFRDVEVGDVMGDATPEIVIVTHDQGVVVVLEKTADGWTPHRIDENPDTFVHEVEIGDVDGDGHNEIFATPSAPNRVDGSPQPGRVVMYRYDGKEFTKETIAESDDRHFKEILLADVIGAGTPQLYTVLEAELNTAPAAVGGDEVEIDQVRFENGTHESKLIARLPDKQCRFLLCGDVNADGKQELVASAFKSGIWVITHDGDTWKPQVIDDNSSGYEHAAALGDFDGDGTPEIYAAGDDQGKLCEYRWNGDGFTRSEIFDLTKGDITFGLMACLQSKYLTAP